MALMMALPLSKVLSAIGTTLLQAGRLSIARWSLINRRKLLIFLRYNEYVWCELLTFIMNRVNNWVLHTLPIVINLLIPSSTDDC